MEAEGAQRSAGDHKGGVALGAHSAAHADLKTGETWEVFACHCLLRKGAHLLSSTCLIEVLLVRYMLLSMYTITHKLPRMKSGREQQHEQRA